MSKRKMKHLRKMVQVRTDDELDNDSDADTDISRKDEELKESINGS